MLTIKCPIIQFMITRFSCIFIVSYVSIFFPVSTMKNEI